MEIVKERIRVCPLAGGKKCGNNERDDCGFEAWLMGKRQSEDQTMKLRQKQHSTIHSSHTAWDQRVQVNDASLVSQRRVRG
jgi:hypothetical protein